MECFAAHAACTASTHREHGDYTAVAAASSNAGLSCHCNILQTANKILRALGLNSQSLLEHITNVGLEDCTFAMTRSSTPQSGVSIPAN